MEKIALKIKKINKILKGNEHDPRTNGLILKSTWKGKVAGHSAKPIKTGIAVEIPDGYYGVILNSTNLIDNNSILNRPKIISSFDRDEIILSLVNYSPYPEPIYIGQPIGILVLMPKIETEIKSVARLKQIKTEG